MIKNKIIFTLCTVIFYISYLNFAFYNGEEVFSKYVFVDTKFCKVLRINGKLIRHKEYIFNDFNIEESGFYTLYFSNEEFLSYESSYVNEIRWLIDIKMKRNLKGDLYSLSKAIFLGEREKLDKNTKILFKENSISHLFALSGMHLSIIYSFISYILFFFNKRIKDIICFIIITIYVFLVGFMPSITRAYMMLTLLIMSRIFFENISSKRAFLISLILTIAINPFQILDIAYILSYITTGVMVFLKDKNIFVKNIVISLAMFPFSLFIFKNFRLISPFINIIIIPIFEILVYLIFFAIIFNTDFLYIIANSYYEGLIMILEILYKIGI